MRRLAIVTCLGLAACGDPDPSVDPPAAPAENDPEFAFNGLVDWYLIGDDVTPGRDELVVRVTGPASYVDMWIDEQPGIRLEPRAGGFERAVDISDLAAGEHRLLFAADSSDTAFAQQTITRTYPMYFQVTTDWDFADPSDVPLDFQDQMHDEHPGLLVTNFVGPYTFTDPTVTDAREGELVDWLEHTRDDFGDEIALHIHPYCNFVEYAGLTCNTDDSLTQSTDNSGYTVRFSAYTEAEQQTMFETADQLFLDAGFDKPTTFRTGAWAATIETLRALEAAGYVADTSAANWEKLEEWSGPLDGTLYDWNMEHWAPINGTSQPYYPNEDDILSDESPNLGILEVPDNAIMVDYVEIYEMIEIFDANWDGTALDHPVSFMMGWHPSSQFSAEEQGRIAGILDHADKYLASKGKGPVVYALLRDMPKVWKQQP